MNWLPGTHLAVDEAMIAFRGRTNHKVKMKNKPIDKGYKTWMLAENDYTIAWLWYSKVEGPEGISKEGILISSIGYLSPTFAIVIYLARILRNIYLSTAIPIA